MNLIVNFTPTGMIPTKKMTPHVPISVNEIVDDVHEALEIGITMVHLHARDEKTGESIHRAGVYRDIIDGIRKFSKESMSINHYMVQQSLRIEKICPPLVSS